MGLGRKRGPGGGGAALNFDVVRYATESALLAATPKENTIGIISNTEMTGWIVDAKQPENMTNGMVWISVGTESAVEFNALKKNAIQVYPLFAKQYASGAWINRPVKSYQGGKWVTWWNGDLYNRGDSCADITGGWETAWTSQGGGSLTLDATKMTIDRLNNVDYYRVRTVKKIDLSGKNNLYLNFTAVYSPEANYWEISIHVGADNVSKAEPSYIATAKWQNRVVGTTTTISVPIPAGTGSEYVTIGVIGKSKFDVHKVWVD